MSNQQRTTPREHGTQACYVFGEWGGDSRKGCRCEVCKEGNTRRYHERKARIEPAYVAADRAREHVAWLSTQGVGLKQVVKISGVSQGAIWKLMYGKRQQDGTQVPSKRITRVTEQAILAVMPSEGADGSRVPAAPTLALIDRLVAAGVPKVRIAERVGQTGPGLQVGGQFVTRRIARAVKEMADDLDAGTLVTVRRSRHGVHTIAPSVEQDDGQALRDVARRAESRERQRKHRMGDDYQPGPIDDIDELYLGVAVALERRMDEGWRAEAACRRRAPWMWFQTDRRGVAAAKKVCGACFVRAQCLEANLSEPDGIYGGLTPDERRVLRQEATA